MRQDHERYTQDERSEIETLYQVANKKWGTDETKLKVGKDPVLVELEVKTTTKKDRWGSRIKGWK